jgi:hypothetical protein
MPPDDKGTHKLCASIQGKTLKLLIEKGFNGDMENDKESKTKRQIRASRHEFGAAF